MKINIIGHTTMDSNVNKEDISIFSGLNAGMCYMPDTWETLKNEPTEKTLKRVDRNISGEHHSVFDHFKISFVFEGIPKFLAMLLNNQHLYDTSEKSARYTKMALTEKEQAIYDKWLKIFLDLIDKKYPKEKYNNCAYWGMTDKANDSKRIKLAQENARYLISVFTPTNMSHSLSIRQLNYVYNYLIDLINTPTNSNLIKQAKPYIEEFLTKFDKELIYPELNTKSKNVSLSWFDKRGYEPKEIFDDIYQTSYEASLAQIAQAQRHRVTEYTYKELETMKYFVPPILLDDDKLVRKFLEDLERLEAGVPQATKLKVYESGTLDKFILKMKERKCSYAQLEINKQTDSILKKYIAELEKTNHPRAEELKKYARGSRCAFPDYSCKSPCGFKEGINGTRII